MDKQEVENLINNSKQIQDFLAGTVHTLTCSVAGTHICIFKEDVGVSYYYKLPWNKNIDYTIVSDFMKFAIPIISKMIEEERNKNLKKPDF